ncbi:MAG: alpha-1,2-fucosyltransferase [Bacteroidia bacterium]|nr:alpha-1,2-fucosyltransferase [Bacteroidia bacterium]
MIIVCLMGGLGNQMFQYAAGKSLSMKLNTELCLDLSFLEKDPAGAYTKRNFELDKLHVRYTPFPASLNGAFKHWGSKRFLNLKFLISGYRLYKEKAFVYDDNFFKLSKNSYLIGIFQNENYFKNIRKELLSDFEFKKEFVQGTEKQMQDITNQTSVSVHIRRGDYANNPHTREYHGLCPIEYYHNAIHYMKSKLENPMFYFFSDDIEFCKKNFQSDNFFFMENHSSYQDMHLMKHCKHHIIANSSFSWWGAWLCENQHKIVIAPKYWLKNKETKELKIIPDNWIVMK